MNKKLFKNPTERHRGRILSGKVLTILASHLEQNNIVFDLTYYPKQPCCALLRDTSTRCQGLRPKGPMLSPRGINTSLSSRDLNFSSMNFSSLLCVYIFSNSNLFPLSHSLRNVSCFSQLIFLRKLLYPTLPLQYLFSILYIKYILLKIIGFCLLTKL